MPSYEDKPSIEGLVDLSLNLVSRALRSSHVPITLEKAVDRDANPLLSHVDDTRLKTCLTIPPEYSQATTQVMMPMTHPTAQPSAMLHCYWTTATFSRHWQRRHSLLVRGTLQQTSAWPVTLSRKLMFNPSSGVWFWDGTIALTGELSHLRILIIVYDFLLDWITSHEFSFSHDFLWFIVGLNHILWVGFFSWFPMIYCWIESHPVDWVFPLISCDFLLDWITSCELAFSLDFPWFTVELNHIPWIGFFSWFPVIYCQIESHPVNWVFPAISCLIELHPVHLVVPMISCWIKYWHPEWDVWYDWTKDYYNEVFQALAGWEVYDTVIIWLTWKSCWWCPCIVACGVCLEYLLQ